MNSIMKTGNSNKKSNFSFRKWNVSNLRSKINKNGEKSIRPILEYMYMGHKYQNTNFCHKTGWIDFLLFYQISQVQFKIKIPHLQIIFDNELVMLVSMTGIGPQIPAYKPDLLSTRPTSSRLNKYVK